MILRTFTFRVAKKKERTLVKFMRRPSSREARLGIKSPLQLLNSIPGCRAAYFTRSTERKGEYLWVTLWTSDAARRAAQRRKDWQAVVEKEETQFFAGRPQARHYRVLLSKKG